MFPFLQTDLKTKEKHATFDIGSQDNRRSLAVEKNDFINRSNTT